MSKVQNFYSQDFVGFDRRTGDNMVPPPLKKVLVIGGGFSGMSAAIELRKIGLEVDLVEIDPGWRAYGAGLSLGGATMRAFRRLGILGEFLRVGNACDGIELRTTADDFIATIPTPRIAGDDIPGNGAIMRPELGRILADATRASGTSIHLGCTFESMHQDAEGVDVVFTDGRRARYQLVIGADGLYSSVRKHLMADAPQPQYSGQAVWRAMFSRPAEVKTTILWMGGKSKAGVNPVSATQMYLFLTENRPENTYVKPEEFTPRLRELLAEFTAPLLQNIRSSLGEESQIVYRPLEAVLVPRPWHRGRIVLIGDTVHATTPHMASGACIGIEDAIVLADELAKTTEVGAALQAFANRRWERCRMVVENSNRLGEIEITGGDKSEHAHIMQTTMQALAAPI